MISVEILCGYTSRNLGSKYNELVLITDDYYMTIVEKLYDAM